MFLYIHFLFEKIDFYIVCLHQRVHLKHKFYNNHATLFIKWSYCLYNQGYPKKGDESCSIKVRITYRRKQVYYLIGISLLLHEWKNLPISKSPKLIEIRESIKAVFDNIRMHVKKLAEDDRFSFDALYLLLGKATGGAVNTAFKNKIDILNKNGQVGSVIYYKCALASFTKFKGLEIKVSGKM